MTLKLPRIPRLIPKIGKIPFLPFPKRKEEQEGFSAFDPVHDEDGEAPGLRRRLPWIVVAAAYLAVFGIAGGAGFHLWSQSEAIEEEMMALRPAVAVSPLPTIGEAANGEGESGGEEDHGQGEAAETPETPEAGAPSDDGHSDQTAMAPAAEPDAVLTLQPHPNPDLIEETPIGPLPKKAADGRMAWRVYARPYNSLEPRPKVAILVTDLGLNDGITEEALNLPGAMTLGFASYAGGLSGWIQKARDAGHEVVLTLPMEPYDFPLSDPGPYALMTGYDAEQVQTKLNWVMSRATGYVGFVNFQGSKFNGSANALEPLLSRMAARGLLYVDNGEAPLSAVADVARQVPAPAVVADMVLDQPPDRANIVAQLARLEALARTRGIAVGTAHPFPATLSRLRAWSRELAAKGIALIPLSAVAAGDFQKARGGTVSQ